MILLFFSTSSFAKKPYWNTAEEGHLHVVNRLLEFRVVEDNVAANNNMVLRWAAEEGRLDVVNRLLEFTAVQEYVSACNNSILESAASASGKHV